MKIVNFKENLSPTDAVAVTIGNFDGLHLGHQALIKEVVEEARFSKCNSALVTFDPHPQEVLREGKQLPRICTPELTIRLLEEMGLDSVHIIPFTKEFSQLSPQDFALHFLIERFKLIKVVIGYDFCFGKNRLGNAATLEKLSHQYRFKLKVVSAVQAQHQIISSSLIRELLQATEFKQVSYLLNREYSILGKVEQGEQRGRTLGFPTANIIPGIMLPIPNGVYVVRATLDARQIFGVSNIGVRPTFAQNKLSVETYLFDFNQDIYGKSLEIVPLKFLRAELKFSSPQALQAQIQADIQSAQNYLATLS